MYCLHNSAYYTLRGCLYNHSTSIENNSVKTSTVDISLNIRGIHNSFGGEGQYNCSLENNSVCGSHNHGTVGISLNITTIQVS